MKKNKLGQHCNEVTQQLFEEGNSNEKQLTLLAEISQNFSNRLIFHKHYRMQSIVL